MAFECEHCSFRNSEVQMGGFIPEKGVRFELTVAKGDMKVRPPSRRQGVSHASCAQPDAPGAPRLPRRAVSVPADCQGRHRDRQGAAQTLRSTLQCPRAAKCVRWLTRRNAAVAQIPELELEIPSLTQRGTMTTVRVAAAPARARASVLLGAFI